MEQTDASLKGVRAGVRQVQRKKELVTAIFILDFDFTNMELQIQKVAFMYYIHHNNILQTY